MKVKSKQLAETFMKYYFLGGELGEKPEALLNVIIIKYIHF